MKHAAAALLAITAIAAVAHPACADQSALMPGQPIMLPGPAGRFDYMTFDSAHDRVYASHPGADALAVLDLTTGDAEQINLGSVVNGVATDAKHDRFFTAGHGHKLFVLDANTLASNHTLDLDGSADGIFYDAPTDRLFVDEDDGKTIWVYNPETNRISDTVAINGGPESSVFVASSQTLFQSIEPDNTIEKIDLRTGTTLAVWPTAPVTAPHGLVMDDKTGRLYSSGKNHEMVVIDTKSGRVVQALELPSGTDQLAYDSKLRRIYSPGSGSMSVVQLDKHGNATVIDTITVPDTAHTVCIDPKTHTVWISYTGTNHSYFQPFTPTKP